MNSPAIWGSEAFGPNGGAAAAAVRSDAEVVLGRSEAAADNRLNTLREVALTLLREVDSLRVSQAESGKRSVKLHDEVRRFEIDLIRSALGRTAGNQSRAARLLGVKITTLNTKIKRYRIESAGYESTLNDYDKQENAA
jgi:DNA-binding NtrC family response regulator